MTRQDDYGVGNIFDALSNPLRIQILYKLEIDHANASSLARSFDMTIQALRRHIDGLLNSGLIVRNGDNGFTISAIGKASLEHISTFDFLSKHKNYFADHTFSGIPKKLIQRLGELVNCEFVDEPVQCWQKAKDLVMGAEKSLHMMTTMITPEFYITAKELFQKGVQFKILHSKEMTVARGFLNTRQENGWIDAINNGRVEELYVKHLPITTVISEKASLVLFANKKTDMIDGSLLFYSEHPDFRNWCLELFNHYWNEMEKIHPPVLEEV